MKQNALNWFELYVTDIERAKSFYDEILNISMEIKETDDWKIAMFPYECETGVGGCIAKMKKCDQSNPGPGGTCVYLNVEGELDAVISRIPAAGGKILMERTAIPPHGFISLFEDSEGNRVGLHSLS